MLVFVNGSDAFRVQQRSIELIASLAKRSDHISYFDLDEEGGYEQLEQAVKTLCLFSSRDVFVVRNGFVDKRLHGLLVAHKIHDDKERAAVIIDARDPDALKKKDKELFEYLSRKASCCETLSPLDGPQLLSWLVREARCIDLFIDRSTAQRFISHVVGNDKASQESSTSDRTWRIHEELMKLNHAKYGSKNRKIVEDDIVRFVTPAASANVFAFIDAVAGRDRSAAVKILWKHIEDGADPFFLHSMIVYHFRNLLKVRSLMEAGAMQDKIVRTTKLHPFVACKAIAQARQFDLNELKKYFSMLHELEIGAKSGTVDMADGLYRLVFFMRRASPDARRTASAATQNAPCAA